MDQSQLHSLAKEFLEPLISGAWLEDNARASTPREARVAFGDPCTILFKADRPDDYRLALRRSQKFSNIHKGTLSETDVVEAFVAVVNGMQAGLRSWYKVDLRATFPRRVVAKAISRSRNLEESLLMAIDQLSSWSGQQYEGKPIPAAIGFVPGGFRGIISLEEFFKEQFSAVLTNGFDTMLTCNFDGLVLGHETLPAPTTSWPFAPHRFHAIAEWAKQGRIALTLNRAGEILVFENKRLRFTRRAGQWHFLTHTPIITQMGRPDDRSVRRAVYETCLDASFARTGACLGVVTSNHLSEWRNVAVSESDYVSTSGSTKGKLLAKVIGPNKFQHLDRRLRQELVAIDGATLIDRHGSVLAVGAILRIPGGSTGGGRLAAAKALAALGLGVKVSQDGGIKGFHDVEETPKFQVM